MMVTQEEGENVAPPLEYVKPKPLPMEFWVSNFTLHELVEISRLADPTLQKVPHHILHGFLERMYKKVKEQMEKGTTDEDYLAKKGEEPVVCAICSDECKHTEERANFDCGHTYHANCILPILRTKVNSCLICGQELHCYFPVGEGQSIVW
ncbi:uncharacterized protein LOC130137745 [Syzygium oleosum]|uniref:uncharacterized protein LOC130137745 n=1 Tax=Syzygium oleosum TaxID=219896 RepID=UPI0024B97518|nr:uncharacterized protein LOC130137745 [Syzygium oleosum]